MCSHDNNVRLFIIIIGEKLIVGKYEETVNCIALTIDN